MMIRENVGANIYEDYQKLSFNLRGRYYGHTS